MEERVVAAELLQQLVQEMFLLDELPTGETRMSDLPGWDSLAFLELVEAIERRTAVRLTDVDVVGVGTLAQLAAVLEARRG